jgi:hypothetical protein
MLRGCNVASVEAAHSATARAGSVPLVRVGAAEMISAIAAVPRKAACAFKEKVVVRGDERNRIGIVNGREFVAATQLNATKNISTSRPSAVHNAGFSFRYFL